MKLKTGDWIIEKANDRTWISEVTHVRGKTITITAILVQSPMTGNEFKRFSSTWVCTVKGDILDVNTSGIGVIRTTFRKLNQKEKAKYLAMLI